MGTVVLAEDTRLGRHVALKTVSGPQAGTPDGRHQLLAEARAAAALSHPAIAAVHDVIEVDGEVAIVFELAEGETLAARLAKGPLPEAQAVAIAVQLADALGVAHAHGVLHRDLKPSNVMLGPGGAVKILDFGIARVQRADAAAGALRDFLGTPGYVAPEQWVGRPTDERADLYALGVVLFEMVSGKRPFPEREPFSLARASLDRIARRLSSLVPEVSPGLDRLVSRLLAADPDLRPPRARVVADELRQLQAPPAPLARPPRWLAWSAAGAVVLALGSWAWWTSRPAPPSSGRPPVIAVMPLENATGDDANDYLAAGVADSLVTSLASLPVGDGAVASGGERGARAPHQSRRCRPRPRRVLCRRRQRAARRGAGAPGPEPAAAGRLGGLGRRGRRPGRRRVRDAGASRRRLGQRAQRADVGHRPGPAQHSADVEHRRPRRLLARPRAARAA